MKRARFMPAAESSPRLGHRNRHITQYSAWFGIERVILEAQAHDLAVGKWELGLVDLVHIPEAGAHGSQLR